MSDRALLDAYFSRIGYGGPAAATLDVLTALHAAHPAAIAFENLDSLMGQVPRLDIDALDAKLLKAKRGGYCYEQNGLFAHVLKALGFRVTGLAARSLWSVPPGVTYNPRTHMLLRIDLPEGAFIADVGFGGLTLTAPLRLAPNVEQPTPYIVFRLMAAGDGEWDQQVKIGDVWKTTYRFSQLPQIAEDYAAANWMVASRPGSIMRIRLMAALCPPGCRYTLADNVFTTYRGGAKDERILADAAEIEKVLEETFAIALPRDRAALRAALERLLRGEAR